jgi:hypothetical protein
MDAYDHIQESTLAPETPPPGAPGGGGAATAQNSLNADFQDAYKAISSSPWGARLGGFFGSVVRQVSLRERGRLGGGRRATRGRGGGDQRMRGWEDGRIYG